MPERAAFLPEEWQALAKLGLKSFQDDEPCAIESAKLLDDVICLETLHTIMPELGAPNLKVTASLVMKRIAFLNLAPVLYAMSSYSKGLDGSIQNSIFEYSLEKRIWTSKMPLKNIQTWYVQDNRSTWRDEILQRVLAGNLSLLVHQFYQLTRVPQRILWENIAVRVFSIYERRILPNLSGTQKALAQDDYAYLLSEHSTHVFGLEKNPLALFEGKKVPQPNVQETIRVRRTCCFYYQATEPAEYCSNCPLLFCKTKKALC